MTLKNLSWPPVSLSRRRLCCIFGALAVSTVWGFAGSSYVWIENPTTTNFPGLAQWDILRGGQAPAVTSPTTVEGLYAEYDLEVPAPGGSFQLWGRTYDPAWSAPARWRVDGQAWQEWKPGEMVDREVFGGNYVMEWHSWGKVDLAPGKHTLRVELTGKRPTGDIPFFVLDSLLLAKGDFQPKGSQTPDDLVAAQQELVKVKLTQVKGSQEHFSAESNAIAQEALNDNMGAVAKFAALNEKIDRTLEAERLIQRSQTESLSGAAEPGVVKDGVLHLDTRWSHAFEGNVWIGLVQDRALYGVFVMPVSLGKKHVFDLTLPADLPPGPFTAVCVPIDQIVSRMPRVPFNSPAAHGTISNLKPFAWGIYRDSSLRVHPWNVTKGGMMTWDGAPHIPIGGMINTKLSWMTRAGEEVVPSTDALDAQFALLRKYGLKDIYFNAFLPYANPAALATAIASAERAGMHYGLHITSVPEEANIGRGFVRWERFSDVAVKAGAKEVSIRIPVQDRDIVPNGRCAWVVLSASGAVLASGVGIPEAQPHQVKGKEETGLTKDLVLNASWPTALAEPGRLIFTPELRLAHTDPLGYLDGLEEYISSLKEVYGSLSFGPGLRMWIDPFINELHYPNTQISTSSTFRDLYAAKLLKKYVTIEALNQSWAPKGNKIADFATAARLIPLNDGNGAVLWMDPETQRIYPLSAEPGEATHDLTRFKGSLVESMISRVADALKEIADVPVILKHNCWFSDWMVNPNKAGGQDGVGFESYCYGDSLAYHNSLVPLSEALASARHQWMIETETASAAFDGQKPYVGGMDRLQMLNDYDLMAMFGSKGIFTFGFAFDPPGNYQITELIRDPRQLEWMSTYAKTIRAASSRLADYLPEVYGWYPASLRERQLYGKKLAGYEMDGHYLGTSGQIRMAPDGRWIIPALVPDMHLQGLLVPWNYLTRNQQQTLVDQKPNKPVWLLGDKVEGKVPTDWKSYPLNNFSASGIGVIPERPRAMTLEQFREKVMGYRVFQTSGANGQTLPDGTAMIWASVERDEVNIKLPATAELFNLQGGAVPTQDSADGGKSILLKRLVQTKHEGNVPVYLNYLPTGYYYDESSQEDTVIVKGATVDQILGLNPPAWHRWLPEGVKPEAVSAWIEAENPIATTFVQPRVEGYSRYSEGAGIGMNTHWAAPVGDKFFAKYEFEATSAFTSLWVRRMSQPAMDLEIWLDGKQVGKVSAKADLSDKLHLSPWNAGLSMDNLEVGWFQLPVAGGPGKHTLELVAIPYEDETRRADLALLGGQSDKSLEKEASAGIKKLQALQIDALMFAK